MSEKQFGSFDRISNDASRRRNRGKRIDPIRRGGRWKSGEFEVRFRSSRLSQRNLSRFQIRQTSGDPSAVAPPVPIPNTEVKHCSPDDSACLACAKVGRRQYYNPAPRKRGAGFLCSDPSKAGVEAPPVHCSGEK